MQQIKNALEINVIHINIFNLPKLRKKLKYAASPI